MCAAIKRPGRIDRQYLLLQFDLSKRKAIIRKLTRDIVYKQIKASNPNLGADNIQALIPDIPDEQITVLAKAAVFLGFKEIQGAINQSIDGANGQIEVGKLLSKLRETPRSSSLDQYLERLTEKPFPIEEFVKAVDFAREAGMKNDVEKKIDALDGDHKSNWDKLNKNDTVKAAMERLRA